MLDVKMLIDMPAGIMFATGVAMDEPDGLFLANTGKKLRWVAIRSNSQGDWAIYCHLASWSIDEVARNGDKVGTKNILDFAFHVMMKPWRIIDIKGVKNGSIN